MRPNAKSEKADRATRLVFWYCGGGRKANTRRDYQVMQQVYILLKTDMILEATRLAQLASA